MVSRPGGLLAGKLVLVTASGGTGIGFATARRCLEEGADVVLSDAHERRLAVAMERLTKLGPAPRHAIVCDVTSSGQVDAMIAEVADTEGRLDVLVNNAGLGAERLIAEMSDAEWLHLIDVNLGGTFRCTRAAVRQMTAQGNGAIVNVASVLGWRAQAGYAHYAAAKAGVMALTRCAAMEVARAGVRINAVAPSFAESPSLARVADARLLESLRAKEAFGRGADPIEVANVIVFLASDLASYMTGEVISVSSQHP